MHFGIKLPPEPRSASEARHWVRDHLQEIGRPDLVPSAEAGVSELVTNGILHAHTLIGLQLSRTRGRVIIEVYDGSPMSQHANLSSSQPGPADSTVGRGLRIVRAHAREWGVSTTPNGKAIWFQPTTAPDATEGPEINELPEAEDDLDEDLPLDIDGLLDSLAEAFPEDMGDDVAARANGVEAAADTHDTVRIRLLNSPPWVVHHHRKRWLELIRELQLVALGEPSPQQEMARRFCAVSHVANADVYITEASALEYARALADHTTSIEAVFEVPRSARSDFVEMRELARQLERWAAGDLLYLTPGRQAAELREWWLGEFISQLDGEAPTPWDGDSKVRDDALVLGDRSARVPMEVPRAGVRSASSGVDA